MIMPRKPLDIGRILGPVKTGIVLILTVMPYLIGLLAGLVVWFFRLCLAAVVEGYEAAIK